MTHQQPEINRNAAEAEVDDAQLNVDGTTGPDYDEIAREADAQSTGTRNDRVIHESGSKHASQPFSEDIRTAYDSNRDGDASGITNQPLSIEKQPQREAGSEQKQPSASREDRLADLGLPKPGMATITDTVEISTEKPKR